MKLLVCFDGSEQSYKAVEAAKELADGYDNAEITLLHVYPEKEASIWQQVKENKMRPSMELTSHERLLIERFMQVNKMVKKVEEEFDKKRRKVTVKIVKGDPVKRIASFAAEENYDLIVIGSRGLGGVKKFMLGSVSSGVIKQATINVLIVK